MFWASQGPHWPVSRGSPWPARPRSGHRSACRAGAARRPRCSGSWPDRFDSREWTGYHWRVSRGWQPLGRTPRRPRQACLNSIGDSRCSLKHCPPGRFLEIGDGGVIVQPASAGSPETSGGTTPATRFRLPCVSTANQPMLVWLNARLLRYSVTAGFSSAQLPLDRNLSALLRYDSSALVRLAGVRLQVRTVVDVADCQAASEFGDGGVVVGQLLPDRQRAAVRLHRPPRPDRLSPTATVEPRRCCLWLSARRNRNSADGKGCRRPQLLPDRRRAAVRLPAPRPANGLSAFDCSRPMLLWLSARRLRNSVTAGLSSASFCWIANARPYDSSASADLPVCDCRRPMLLWLSARRFRKSATAGLSSASFCADRQSHGRYDSSASAVVGPSTRLQPADADVANLPGGCRNVGDGGVFVGQLLADRQSRGRNDSTCTRPCLLRVLDECTEPMRSHDGWSRGRPEPRRSSPVPRPADRPGIAPPRRPRAKLRRCRPSSAASTKPVAFRLRGKVELRDSGLGCRVRRPARGGSPGPCGARPGPRA